MPALARSIVFTLMLATLSGCAFMATPPRDQIMRMERARGLAIDAAEAAFAAGQLDRQRRDVVKTGLTQLNAAIEEANALRKATTGAKLVDDSAPVARFDAALARVNAALQAAEADAAREKASYDRRQNQFLDQLLGAASVPTTKPVLP